MNLLQLINRYQVVHRTKYFERLTQCNLYSTTIFTNKINDKLLNNNNNVNRQCNNSVHTLKSIDMNETKPGLFKRILKSLGYNSVAEAKIRVNGYNLYESVVDQLDYEYWMNENQMEDNFMSWFLITELHVWMLLVRCMAESDDGKVMRNSTIEALWADVSIRSVKYHPGKRSLVRKQVQLLSQEFQAALVNYDEGMVTNDIVLAGAVWRRFFLMNNEDPILIENIVRYIRKQLCELDRIPKEQFFKNPTIKWTPLNDKKI